MKKRSKILLAALFAVCSVSLLTAATCTSSHTHTYGDVVWAWSDDGTSAQASVSCTDGDDTLTADATVKQTDYTDPTCTEAGTITYTATVTLNGVSYTSVKTVEGEAATGHKTVTHSGGVAATLISAGSSEYWYCADCGNYYSDSACTKELESADLPALASVYDSIYAGLSSTGSVAEGTELFNGFITTTGSVSWYNSISNTTTYTNTLTDGYEFNGRLYLTNSASGLTFTLDNSATIIIYSNITSNNTIYIRAGSTTSGSYTEAFTATSAQSGTITAYETDLKAGTYTICTENGAANIFAIVLEGSGYTEGLVNYSEITPGTTEELEDNQFLLEEETEYTFTATQSGYYTFTVPEDSGCVIWKSEADYTGTDYTVTPYLDANEGSYYFEIEIASGSSITLYLTGAESVVVTYTFSESQYIPTVTTSIPDTLQEGYNYIVLSAEDSSTGLTSTFKASADGTYIFSTNDSSAWITLNGDATRGIKVYAGSSQSLTLEAGDTVTAYFYSYNNGESAEYYLYISEHTHSYGTPAWSWSEDYSAATATFSCTSGDDDQQVTATVTSETTAATCTENGKIVYTATATFDGTEYTGTKTVVIPATNHTYGDAVWTWSEDNSTATVSFACISGDDTQTFDAKVTSETTAATCTAEGKTVYTATITFNGTEYTNTKTETIAASGHTYDEPTWIWATDYSSAKATFTCTAGDDTHTLDATITSKTTKATCTTDGETVYTATVTFDNNNYTYTKTTSIPATGHTYGEPVWAWSEDYSTATVTFTCSSGDDTQEITAAVTNETTAATCTADGKIVYTATATLEDKEYTETKTVVLEMLKHTLEHHDAVAATESTAGNKEYWQCSTCNKYFTDAEGTAEVDYNDIVIEILNHTHSYDNNNISWSWSEDYSSATATLSCDKGDNDLVGTATATSETTAATCTADGKIVYTATVTLNEKAYTNTQTVTLAATGHTYGDPVWNWAEDYSSATATFTCTASDDTQTVTAEVTSSTTAATCTKDGEIVYTATVTFDGTEYTDNQTVSLNATGHTFDAPVWVWASDYSSAKATLTCTAGDDIETLDATVTSDITAATCTADGEAIYTATVTLNGTEYTDTQTVTLNATGHSYKATWSWDEEYEWAEVIFTCSKCGDEQTLLADLTDDTTEATCTTSGISVYTATITFNGEEYTDTTTAVLSAKGHKYKASWSWADDYSSATATITCSRCGDSHTLSATITSSTYDGTTYYEASATFNGEEYTSSRTVEATDGIGNGGTVTFTTVYDEDYEDYRTTYTYRLTEARYYTITLSSNTDSEILVYVNTTDYSGARDTLSSENTSMTEAFSVYDVLYFMVFYDTAATTYKITITAGEEIDALKLNIGGDTTATLDSTNSEYDLYYTVTAGTAGTYTFTLSGSDLTDVAVYIYKQSYSVDGFDLYATLTSTDTTAKIEYSTGDLLNVWAKVSTDIERAVTFTLNIVYDTSIQTSLPDTLSFAADNVISISEADLGTTKTYTLDNGTYVLSVDEDSDAYLTVYVYTEDRSETLYYFKLGKGRNTSYTITVSDTDIIEIKFSSYSKDEATYNLYLEKQISYTEITLGDTVDLLELATANEKGYPTIYLSYTATSAGTYVLTLDGELDSEKNIYNRTWAEMISTYGIAEVVLKGETTDDDTTLSASNCTYTMSLSEGVNYIVITISSANGLVTSATATLTAK